MEDGIILYGMILRTPSDLRYPTSFPEDLALKELLQAQPILHLAINSMVIVQCFDLSGSPVGLGKGVLLSSNKILTPQHVVSCTCTAIQVFSKYAPSGVSAIVLERLQSSEELIDESKVKDCTSDFLEKGVDFALLSLAK